MLKSLSKINRATIIHSHYNKSRYLSSNNNNNNDDFFSNFKKRIQEETAKEDENIQNIHTSSQFKKLRKNILFLSNKTSSYIDESNKILHNIYTKSNEYTDKYKQNIAYLKSKYHFINDLIEKINKTYQHNITYKLNRIDPNNKTYKFCNKFYYETIGFFFKNAPKPYSNGCSENLHQWTKQLESTVVIPCDRKSILYQPRTGISWFYNDYVMNFEWCNRIKFYARNSNNPIYRMLIDSIYGTKRFLQNCFVNKDSIDTYKSIYMFNPKFDKEIFLYNWENIIIPGLLDIIINRRNMDLLKKWTTPECYQLISSSKDFFDNCKILPIILDIYDTDIVTMKKMEKSSSSLILLRFSIIVNQKIIDPNDPTKSTNGPGFKEIIINWAIQTNSSHGDNDLGFVVADFGSSIASIYGYST